MFYGLVILGEIVDVFEVKGIIVDCCDVDLMGGIKMLGEYVVCIDLYVEVVVEVIV